MSSLLVTWQCERSALSKRLHERFAPDNLAPLKLAYLDIGQDRVNNHELPVLVVAYLKLMWRRSSLVRSAPDRLVPWDKIHKVNKAKTKISPVISQTSIVSRPNLHLKPKLLAKPILWSATCRGAQQSVHHVSPRQRLFVPIFGRIIFLNQPCVFAPIFGDWMRFLCQIDAFAPGQALMGDKLFKTGEETFKTKVACLL